MNKGKHKDDGRLHYQSIQLQDSSTTLSKMQDDDEDEFEKEMQQSTAFLDKSKGRPKNPEKKLFTPAPVSIDLDAEDDEENDPAFQATLEAMRRQPTEQIVQSAQQIIPPPSSAAAVASNRAPMDVTQNTPASMMQQSSVPMEVTRKSPASGPPGSSSSSSSARQSIIPKKGGSQAMPKTESKSNPQQQPGQNPPPPPPSSSSNSGKRKRDKEEEEEDKEQIRKKARNETTEKMRMKAADAHIDPVKSFGLKLQAIMYKATDLDERNLLGSYIIRWMFFTAMEQLASDGGRHWFEFLHGCIYSYLAKKLLDNAKKWQADSFGGQEVAHFMITFAATIVNIATDEQISKTAAAAAATDNSNMSEEYQNSSPIARGLALLMYKQVEKLVKLEGKDNSPVFATDKKIWHQVRDLIGVNLYKYTYAAVQEDRPPANHAWFIWDFLEECTDEQIRENKENEMHDGSMINELMQTCFIPDSDNEDDKSSCGMLRGLYVVESYLHRVDLEGKGSKKLRASKHSGTSRLKGLTTLVVLLSIANAETMLPSQNKSENAGLYAGALDKNKVFDSLLQAHPSLQADVIQYISTCRAQLKQGRYKDKKLIDRHAEWRKAPSVEKKTKLADWALTKLSSSSSSSKDQKTENKGQGAATLIATVKDFVYRDLTAGLLDQLGRKTKHNENLTLKLASNLLDRFLSKRIGTGVVRPILLAESAAANKAKQKGQVLSVFARAFGDAVTPNLAIAAESGDFGLWADIGVLRITDTFVGLVYAGLVWSLALRGDNLEKFDTADSFVIDDDQKNPLIDKPRAKKEEQKSLLKQTHVLISAARSGRGQFLTWWFSGDRWLCTFGVLKTYKDKKDDPDTLRLTILVPTDVGLLLKLHLVDVMEGQQLTEGQIHNNVPLDTEQIKTLQTMCEIRKKTFDDSRIANKTPVDYRVVSALATVKAATTGYDESEKRLGIFSSLPSLVFIQGGVVPVEAWRTQYLGDAKSSLTDAETKDALMRTLNDNLVDQLTSANSRIKVSGEIKRIEVKDDNKMVDDDDKAPELSDIPTELRPAYAGLFDLLAAYRVRGYLADSIKACYTAAGDRKATNVAMKKEILKMHLSNPDVKALNTPDQLQLALRGREAQVAFLNKQLRDVKTNGHPSFAIRISSEIRDIERVIVQLRERAALLEAKAKKMKDALEEVDEFEAAEAVQDAEVHMNAFMQIQSNLMPVIQKLGNMAQREDFQPNLEMIKSIYKDVAASIAAVYKALLVPSENPLGDFQIEEQLKHCKLLVDATVVSSGQQSALVQYWINEAKRLNVKSAPFKDVAALLLLMDRFRTFLIRLGSSFVDKAEKKLQKSEYISHDAGEDEKEEEEADEEEEDEEDANRQFVEDKALQTEADRMNALDDRSLISVCVSTAQSYSLPWEDLAFDPQDPNFKLQAHTIELLQNEAVTSSHLDASVDITKYNTQQMDMDSVEQQQQLVLTREGKQQVRFARRTNAEALKHAQLVINASERKKMDETGDDDDDDEEEDENKKSTKKKKKKRSGEGDVAIEDDADRAVLRRRITRLRIVIYLLDKIIDPETSGLDLPTSVLEPYTKDLATIKDPTSQIRYLLNEEKEKFNKRANKLFQLEFVARDAIDKEDRKQRLEFVDGANKAMDEIKKTIGRFSKRDVGKAKKQQQRLTQVGRERLISMQFRGGRAHPQLPLQPLMEEVCAIVHQDRRPRIWILMDTAANLLKYATPEALDRWTIRPSSFTDDKKKKKKKTKKDGPPSVFKDDQEKYLIINRIVLSGCLPYRVLRAQLLFGLVPSIASIGDGDDILDPNNADDPYHLHLLDLEKRLTSAKEIKDPRNFNNGTIGIDTAIRIFLSKHSDGVMTEEEEEKKKKEEEEKKKKKKKKRMIIDDDDDDDDDRDLTDDVKHEQVERFLAMLCSKLYDRRIDAEAEMKKQRRPEDMITTEDNLSTIEAGYDWKRGEAVLSRVLETFEAEFEHNALDEKAIQKEIERNTLKDVSKMDDVASGGVSLVAPELIRNRMKRDHVMNALFNKAVEWRLPPPERKDAAAAPAMGPATPENDMLCQLAIEQVDYMYSNIRQYLLQPMIDDIKRTPLTDCGVLPEIQDLLLAALGQAVKPETITGPIKAALTTANSQMDMLLGNFWKAMRVATQDKKLPDGANQKLFGMDSEPMAVLGAFQKDGNFKMKHLMRLMQFRYQFYRMIQASIRYLQLLPLLIQVVRITIPDRESFAFSWKAPPANLGLAPTFLLNSDDRDLRQAIYREFQAVSEILTSGRVYLPTHLDFQGVLEAYWGLETVDTSPHRQFGGERDDLVPFNMLYPCPKNDSELETLQTVRRMLGWQNPRDGLEFYVYKRQIPGGKNFDISKYRDPIAPVHWENGTIRLEELKLVTYLDDDDDSKEEKQQQQSYAYWNEDAIALRHAAKLARVHFGLASDGIVINETKSSSADVFKTLARAVGMLKDERVPVQHILTRLAIPVSLDSRTDLAPFIKEANNSGLGGANRQHLYRGVFTLMAGAKKVIVTAGGSNNAGVVKKDKDLRKYLQDTDSASLGLRAEDDQFYTDVNEDEAADDDNQMQDDGDEQKTKKKKKEKKREGEDEDEVIGRLTLPDAATAVYFKDKKKTTGIAQLGKFAHWATVRAWQNKDNQLRDKVIYALGGKVPVVRKKAKKTAKDQAPLALPRIGEGKETKAEPPVVVNAPSTLPRPSSEQKQTARRKLMTTKESETFKREQTEGIRSSLTVQSNSSKESMAPYEVAQMAVDMLAKEKAGDDPMNTTSGRFDETTTTTPAPQRKRRRFYVDSNPVVVSAITSSTDSTHPASLVPMARSRRKLLFEGLGKELERVPVSVSVS